VTKTRGWTDAYPALVTDLSWKLCSSVILGLTGVGVVTRRLFIGGGQRFFGTGGAAAEAFSGD